MYQLVLNGEVRKEASSPFKPVRNGWVNQDTGVIIQGGHDSMEQTYVDDDPENPVEPAPYEGSHPGLSYPALSVPSFKMCFTSNERLAIYALKDAGDLVITDWLSILDDPRCTIVDLGLSSTREAVQYLVDKVEGFTSDRAAAVIKGTMI